MVTRVTTPGNYSAVLANLLAAQNRQMAAGDKVATQRNGNRRSSELLKTKCGVTSRFSRSKSG